jgi:hypothetical protein
MNHHLRLIVIDRDLIIDNSKFINIFSFSKAHNVSISLIPEAYRVIQSPNSYTNVQVESAAKHLASFFSSESFFSFASEAIYESYPDELYEDGFVGRELTDKNLVNEIYFTPKKICLKTTEEVAEYMNTLNPESLIVIPV